jgi:hypothetical protein
MPETTCSALSCDFPADSTDEQGVGEGDGFFFEAIAQVPSLRLLSAHTPV